MDSRSRSVSRVLPFGAAVVWDALTDPVLVQGWLAPVVEPVEPVEGAELALDGVPLPGASCGRIRPLEPGRLVELDLGATGTVTLLVTPGEPLESGRSTATCVATAHPGHDLVARGIVAALDARMDALQELLAGRPMEWGAGAADSGDGTERARLW